MEEDKSKQTDNVTNPLILKMRKDLGFANDEIETEHRHSKNELKSKEEKIPLKNKLPLEGSVIFDCIYSKLDKFIERLNNVNIKETRDSVLGKAQNRKLFFKILISIVIFATISIISVWNIYHITTNDITRMADKNNSLKLKDIITNISEYHPYPSQDIVLKEALKAIHEIDSAEFIAIGWDVMYMHKYSYINDNEIIYMLNNIELEKFIDLFLQVGSPVTHDSLGPESFRKVYNRLKNEYSESYAISKINTIQRDKKIDYVKNDILEMFYNVNTPKTYELLAAKFQKYNINNSKNSEMLVLLEKYKAQEIDLDQANKKLSSYKSDLYNNENRVSKINEEISNSERELNMNANSGAYQTLSGYIVSQIGSTSYGDTEYEIVVTGGDGHAGIGDVGKRAILSTNGPKYSSKGMFYDLPIAFRVGDRVIHTIDGFDQTWPVYSEISLEGIKNTIDKRANLNDNIDSLSTEKQQKLNEINKLEGSIAYQKTIVENIEASLNETSKQWVALCDTLKNETTMELDIIAISFVDLGNKI